MKQETKENTIECCGNPLDFKYIPAIPEATYHKEVATCSECGISYERKRGSDIVYRADDEKEGYECTKCGSDVMGANVAHPIWDGLFPMSGSGQCTYEDVPYCPSCEKEPDFHGAPITRR